MEYRRLGKSGLLISLFSLGTWSTVDESMDYKESLSLLELAYSTGINFFDTAEIYNNGRSETALGKELKELSWPRENYLLSSKVFWGTGSKRPNTYGLSRKHIIEACNASLKRLQVDYLDIYYCHRPNPDTPLEETILAMNHLINQGKILYWGTSEWSAEDILQVKMISYKSNLIGPIVEQPQYNFIFRTKVEREFEHLYSLVGLGLTTWSPLLSGLLTGKYNDGVNNKTGRLYRTCYEWLWEKVFQGEQDKHMKNLKLYAEYACSIGIKPSHLALAWCTKNKNVSSVILGASTVNQLKDNLQVIEVIPDITQDIFENAQKIFLN